MQAENSTRLEYLKDKCSENRRYCARNLGRIQTEQELLNFVTRRQIDIPGFSPNFYNLTLHPVSYVNNHEHHSQSENNEPEISPHVQYTEPPRPAQTTVNVREMLVTGIGRHWKSFGRALNMSEGYLDGLQERYPYNLEEKLQEIVKRVLSEENSLARIKRALEKIRRMDLAIQIVL